MEVHIILDRDQTLETDFLSNFSTNLELLNNINNAIVTSLYPKTPTQLFKTKYKKVCKSDVGKECSICFDEYSEKEYQRKLKCGHTFHKKCIDRWINKYKHFSCPTCRQNVFI